MSYSVYKLTSPENKVYVGMTRRRPQRRWASGYKHNPYMTEMISKYGWSSIRKDIIAVGLTQEEAEHLEARLVDAYQSTDRRYGYNIDRGGKGAGIKSEETRRLLAQHMLGDKNPTRRFGHPMQGKRHSEESKAKMSASAKARLARIVTEETKRKLQAVQKKKPVRCVETGKAYLGINMAGQSTGVHPSHISAACKGKRKTAGGYHWEYVDKETQHAR